MELLTGRKFAKSLKSCPLLDGGLTRPEGLRAMLALVYGVFSEDLACVVVFWTPFVDGLLGLVKLMLCQAAGCEFGS